MKRWLFYLLLISLLAGLMTSCNLPLRSIETNLPTSLPPTNTPLPPPTDTPEPVPEPTSDPYANISHSTIPPEPVLTYWAYDCQTGKYTQAMDKPNIGGGCDQWEINFIERPTNQEKSLLYPHLDIVRFQMGKNDTWIFGDLMTYQPESMVTTLNGTYALELDFDIDNDGDLLVMVTNPSGSPQGQWTVTGVQVWEDTNDDVGGEAPVLAEESNPGDGYETLLFDQGLGDDADLAWARIAPDDPATIDFAFKRKLVPNGVSAFLWWTWASQAPLIPGDFDYNDTYGKDEIFQIGNSCRWVFDGPSVPVPNICLYDRPEEPEEHENLCTISYATGRTTISQCVPCPPQCAEYSRYSSLSCKPGCDD